MTILEWQVVNNGKVTIHLPIMHIKILQKNDEVIEKQFQPTEKILLPGDTLSFEQEYPLIKDIKNITINFQ